MSSHGYSKRDLASFGPRIEMVLKESLAHAGIPFHHVEYHPAKDGTAAVEVVSFFSSSFSSIETLIRDQFVIDTERSVCLNARAREEEPLPGTYLAYLNPIRCKLPEWEPFAEEPILILVSSLFQGTLFSILGFFSGENLLDDPHVAQEIQHFSRMAKDLDEGFASLYDRHLGPMVSQSGEVAANPPITEEEPSTIIPAAEKESFPHREKLDMASVRLYLSAGTKVVNMCLAVASENGITAFPLEDTADEQAGLSHLFSFLVDHGIESYEAMVLYFTEELGSWENIYEALEFARASGTLTSREIGLCDLVLILLKGREAPLFQTP